MYSKYSPNCQAFFEMIQQQQFDFSATAGLNMLCIDNMLIRKKIIKSTKINIDVVPCILLLFADGGVEKYDGPNAFQWAQQLISQHQQPPQPQVGDNGITSIAEKQVFDQNVKLNQTIKHSGENSRTSIEDLVSEDETEEDVNYRENIEGNFSNNNTPNHKLQERRNIIREEAKNFNVKSEFEDELPISINPDYVKGIKSSSEKTGSDSPTGSKGGGDLMATALAMQKSREAEDVNKKNPV
jgi:hypothetical protein